jgi:cyclase
MLAKRIVPCLDVKNGTTVKGINFKNLVNAGDPVELSVRYVEEGADELVFLDISASQEARSAKLSWVKEVAKAISIPFSVGGGIKSIEDVDDLLNSGADRVSINSSAVYDPALISSLADKFGSQCVIVAIDAKQNKEGIWKVFVKGGTEETDLELFSWANEMQERGAGEILFTSMDHDGTKNGFAIDALQQMTQNLQIPVIASGGAGKMEDFKDVFLEANVDAALAASVFHYKEIPIPILKKYLQKANIEIRL